jgi:hypothetical protein
VLLSLAQVESVKLISLQKGEGEAQALNTPAGFPLLHLGAHIESFSDTVAILMALVPTGFAAVPPVCPGWFYSGHGIEA